MAFPGFSLAPTQPVGPSAFSSIAGTGLPTTSVRNGPRSQSVAGILRGTGMDPGFDVMHTGRGTSTMDQVSNPRHTVHTQYFIDCENTNVGAELGNMEITWCDVLSGPVGIVGQNKPMVFRSLRGMNTYLHSQEGRLKYGSKLDTRWFNERFSFAGILRHDATANSGRAAGEAGNVCQMFVTGFRGTCYDIWQAYKHKSRNNIGPDIKDVLHVVLKRFPYMDEINRLQGQPSDGSHYWQLCPMFTKHNEDPSIWTHKNPVDGSCGESYRIGVVAVIYGVPLNPAIARGIAQKYCYDHRGNDLYKDDLIKLRRLEIEVTCT